MQIAALQPGYEPEGGPEDDDHEEDDRVDDDELFNFRLHLHQFDPDDRDSDAGSDVSQVRDRDEEVGLGSVCKKGSDHAVRFDKKIVWELVDSGGGEVQTCKNYDKRPLGIKFLR